MNETIFKLVNSIPKDNINDTCFVEFYFYGEKNKLKSIKSLINKNYDIHSFDYNNNYLAINLHTIINQENLSFLDDLFFSYADKYNAEYDGFEISLDKSKKNKKIKSIADNYKSGSVFKIILNDKEFSYCIYLFGNNKDGYIFDFIDGVFYEDLDFDIIEQQPKLYSQPMMAMLDKNSLHYVGYTNAKNISKQVSFRLSQEHPTPEQIDQKAFEYGFDVPLPQDEWYCFLTKLAQNNDKIFEPKLPYIRYTATLTDDNKIVWNKNGFLDCHLDNSSLPALFGLVVDIETLKKTLIEGIDIITLENLTS